ncbi:hypothetical protein PIB30_076111, partial [Stylosanthes scabra]|nr:hypothetical protein [Stylosanthes scabra]
LHGQRNAPVLVLLPWVSETAATGEVLAAEARMLLDSQPKLSEAAVPFAVMVLFANT